MRRVRRKAGNKDKVFGCDLLEHLNASCQEIPQVLRWCSEFVEQKGIVDGIYRLSGVSSNIQKLRSEFESEGRPDLHKDVYLQDIHCVSSLCKAYFRELPNPLLTYQLYDKFAEAVAIQLEEERLVKIRDVLKELPEPHYRTLEFLMQHLVRMASFSSETNMHSRNLAIVWAPNLLRSKDIEASGFNGTAAFMEVRVQSIVVEFILTHVPQLFPEQGVSNVRRKSLPSPSVMSNQNEAPFKSGTIPANFGNISPGDGPLAMRPYHAIIEGTDKRKGSLKGRRWMSIFNIGGRLNEQRKRHKNSAKEKEQISLRPARSMDSLSHSSYPNEAHRGLVQLPLSTHLSPNVNPGAQHSSDVLLSASAIGGSKYAVTYRRGTGLVSGSGGGGPSANMVLVPPEASTGTDTQSRSPGLSTKAGRRAAMHITGPTMVTVPLHITSNLALGVLQGGGGDRVIHCRREKDGGEKSEQRESGKKVEEPGKAEEEEERKESGNMKQAESTAAAGGGDAERDEEGGSKTSQAETDIRPQSVSSEEHVHSFTTNDEEQQQSESEQTEERDSSEGSADQRAVDECEVFETSEVLNSTEVDDQELCGYIQDNFEFLDQMDCSILDHMDSGVCNQVIEFSVEPPGHSDEEYEHIEQHQSLHHHHHHHHQQHPPSKELLHSLSQSETHPLTESKPLRPVSLDLHHSRHTKYLSLPFMSSPDHGPQDSESSSQEEESVSEDSSDGYECMLGKSLPSDVFLNNLAKCELDTQHHLPDNKPLNLEDEDCKEERGVHQGQDQEDEDQQRKPHIPTTDSPSEENAPASNCAQFPLQGSETTTAEEENKETPVNIDQDLSDNSTADEERSIGENSKNTESVWEEEKESDGNTNEEKSEMEEEEQQEHKQEHKQEEEEEEEEEQEQVEEEEEEEEEQEQEQQEDSSTCSDTWDELHEIIISEVMEDCESETAGGQEEEMILMVSEETINEDWRKTEVKVHSEEEMLISEAQEENSFITGIPQPEDGFKHPENKETTSNEQQLNLPCPADREEMRQDTSDVLEGLGSKLVVFKHPKVYQIKAVPVVPPKPQYCKLTSMTRKQQEQHQHQQQQQKQQQEQHKHQQQHQQHQHRWDGADGATKETSRNSPLSMCFDEAVAIATLRREKERREVEMEVEGLRK
ncbi:rho GTPase-activating protein 31 [Gouania willdenowi]|uniref:rho GTPase-activating protein 31 n=1 Tax=Gouania willdenowi TaxID=441366 RepID=UPI0010553186|nr:rho GTPase-activating protein 30 [Gouania willdenowi]XP_028329342.1 rho GTPase-activating protein 30 [Gouania willdenowi]